MKAVSYYAIPVFVVVVLFVGFWKKMPVFHFFSEGAKDGLKSAVSILPTLIGLVTAVSMFKASGALDIISSALSGITELLHIPSQLFPLGMLRPISGSGAIAIVNDLFATYGPDSTIGKIASVMLGSSETTFYAAAIYFGAVHVKKTSYTIPVALLGDFLVVVVSAAIVYWLF